MRGCETKLQPGQAATFNEAPMNQSMLAGHHLVMEVNDYLTEKKITPLVPRR